MKKDVKRIDIKEFREKGYLQEVNRQFLHPLGLALEVEIDEDGNEKLGGVWDYREDEGIYYDLKNSEQDRIDNFIRNENFIKSEQDIIGNRRMKKLGFIVEPITETNDDEMTTLIHIRDFVKSIKNINTDINDIDDFSKRYKCDQKYKILKDRRAFLSHLNSLCLNQLLNGQLNKEEEEKYYKVRNDICDIIKNQQL